MFTGGGGSDTLTGNGGSDTFVYEAASDGMDKIMDFGWGSGESDDILDFSALSMDQGSNSEGDIVISTKNNVDVTSADVVILNSGSYSNSTNALNALLNGITTSSNKASDNDFLFIWERSSDNKAILTHLEDASENSTVNGSTLSDMAVFDDATVSNVATNAAADDFLF